MGNIICEYCGAKVDLAISDRCPVCGAKIRESTQSEGSIEEKIPTKISNPIEKPNAVADREKNSNSTLKIGFIIIGIIVVLGIGVISISISNSFSKQNDASLKSDSYSSYPTPYPTPYPTTYPTPYPTTYPTPYPTTYPTTIKTTSTPVQYLNYKATPYLKDLGHGIGSDEFGVSITNLDTQGGTFWAHTLSCPSGTYGIYEPGSPGYVGEFINPGETKQIALGLTPHGLQCTYSTKSDAKT